MFTSVMSCRRRCLRWVACLAGCVVLGLPSAGEATFPGRNGDVLFGLYSFIAIYGPGGKIEGVTSETESLVIRDHRSRRRSLLRRCTHGYAVSDPSRCAGPWSGRFSPDGRRVAFSFQTFEGEKRVSHVALIGPDGEGFREVPARGLPPDLGALGEFLPNPLWAPDGRSLLIPRDPPLPNRYSLPDLYRVWLASGRTKRITTGGVRDADISAKGELAFTRPFRKRGRLIDGLYRTGLAPGRPRRIVSRRAGEPSWSPDGKRIAFTAFVEGNPQIFTATRTGRRLRRFTRLSSSMPTWSPDGRRMLFFRDWSGGDLFSAPVSGGRSLLVMYNNDTPNIDENSPALIGPADWQPRPQR